MATRVKKGIAPKKNVTAKPKIKKSIVKKVTKKPLEKNPAARQQLPPNYDGILNFFENVKVIPFDASALAQALKNRLNKQQTDTVASENIINQSQNADSSTSFSNAVQTVKVKPALESMVDQFYDNNATAANYIEQIEIALYKIHNNQPDKPTGSGNETIKEERTLLDKFNSRLHWQNSLNHRLFNILQQLNEIA
jgi:hypothetical protein